MPQPPCDTAANETAAIFVGSGAFRYEVDQAWAELPAKYGMGEVVGMAVDSRDRVFVFQRGPRPVIVLDRDGNFLSAWGDELFTRVHGIFIGPDDSVYCTDDMGHSVRKCTSDGQLLLTLGTPGVPCDTGAVDFDYRNIRHVGPPFNLPTNVALAPNGDIYAADGYGNARIHRFSPDGRLLASWGQPGAGPGEFHVSHGVAVDAAGLVYVCDRENSRVQIFSPDGEYLDEWRDLARPCQLCFDAEGNVYVAELGYRAGMFSGNLPPHAGATGGRISVFDRHRTLLARWGGGENPTAPGDFIAPHGICVDSRGDIYLGEVVLSAAANRGLVSPNCHTLQKFVRKPNNAESEPMIITPADLKQFTAAIFAAAGCQDDEARRIAHYLVEANLVGHDSHGVIRIATYVQWLRLGKVLANQSIQIVSENDVIAVVDGQFGFGQTIGEQAVRLGVEKCARQGVSVVALRNAGHLGRIGDWPLMAAAEGKLSLHFVNTSGAGNLVAPFGGIDRRLSANPLAAGVPVAGGEPIILDMSACTMAEGKIRVALNKGQMVPDGCLIDAEGKPTNDPRVFYGDPLGSILPIAGHKGYGLSVLIEILSGALSGGSCTDPKNASRVANNMLSIYFDPDRFVPDGGFDKEVNRFVAWVKSSRTIAPDGTILMPGEIELRTKAARSKAGIELDDNTWGQILDTAESFGVEQNPQFAPYFATRPQSRSTDAAPSSLRGGLPAADSGR